LQVPRLKTYYDYAKKKLGIAEKMGLIPSMPHTGMQILSAIMSDCMLIVQED
jgi:hypothetical protein